MTSRKKNVIQIIVGWRSLFLKEKSCYLGLSETFVVHQIDDFKKNKLDMLNDELDKFSSKYNSFWSD